MSDKEKALEALDEVEQFVDCCDIEIKTIRDFINQSAQLTNSTTVSFPLNPDEYPKDVWVLKYKHGATEVREKPFTYGQRYVLNDAPSVDDKEKKNG